MEAQTAATLEREIKLRFDTADEARDVILAAGATPLRGRRLQEDCLLDTPDAVLQHRRCVLRVHIEAGKSRLTFKGPVQPAAVKVREELETVIGDGEMLLRVFQELGLHVWFRYQKFREEFAAEDATIALDETPIGTFIEIEGGERAILAMTCALGRSPDDFILDSYRSLFLTRRVQFGIEGANMMFADEWSQRSS